MTWIKTCANDIVSKGLARNRSRSSAPTTNSACASDLFVTALCYAVRSPVARTETTWRGSEKRQSCRCVCLMTEQDLVRKGVPLNNTTIAAISSYETQSEAFLGLHYSKEPQVVYFAPREGRCKSSPRSTVIELILVRR
jgi:hypothetical protein